MRPGPSAYDRPDCPREDWGKCEKGTNPGRTHRFYTGTPVVPFGFGLSYTTFNYSELHATSSGVQFVVTNAGAVDAEEVAQLYLGYPAAAGEPPLQLRGFKRVAIVAGASVLVALPIDLRAVSVWDDGSTGGTRGWRVVGGTFAVAVGASSRDIRLRGSFEVDADARHP